MYFLFSSVFLLFCVPNFGHDNNINLSLILLDNTDTVDSASWDMDGYVISRQNNLELHLGCHTCTCWLSY